MREGRDRALRAVLLSEADQRIQKHDCEDRASVDDLAQGERDDRSPDEHPDDKARELVREDR